MKRLDLNKKEVKRELFEAKRQLEGKEKEEKEKERKREEERKEKERELECIEAEIQWECGKKKKERQKLKLMGKERECTYYEDLGWLFVTEDEPCFFLRHPEMGKLSIRGEERFVERVVKYMRGH